MELHKAIKEIVADKGADMICTPQIINYLLDYQAFKEKPATKFILRAIIDSGYAEKILALINTNGWEPKYKQFQQDFINSNGFNENLTKYVFNAVIYSIGLDESIPDDITINQNEKKGNPDLSKLNVVEIMEMARMGNADAILYCTEHMINPFNFDNSFFSDYSNVKVGDWLYDDGSFSRNKSDLKKCVGVIFSIETSPLEKIDGWTHGYIVATRDAAEREWGVYGDLPYPHTHYTSKDLEILKESPNDFKDYQTEYLLKDSDIGSFKVARNFGLGLPKFKTSGWFLPSISQLRQIASNLSPDILDIISMNSDKSYLSSSQFNANEVCYIYISKNIDGSTYYGIGPTDKQSPFYRVRPIAAF